MFCNVQRHTPQERTITTVSNTTSEGIHTLEVYKQEHVPSNIILSESQSSDFLSSYHKYYNQDHHSFL